MPYKNVNYFLSQVNRDVYYLYTHLLKEKGVVIKVAETLDGYVFWLKLESFLGPTESTIHLKKDYSK